MSSVAWLPPAAATIWLADAPWPAVGIFWLLIVTVCNLANIIRALADYATRGQAPLARESRTVDDN
jgi:hypothetical protein